jgi:hypothetical protein
MNEPTVATSSAVRGVEVAKVAAGDRELVFTVEPRPGKSALTHLYIGYLLKAEGQRVLRWSATMLPSEARRLDEGLRVVLRRLDGDERAAPMGTTLDGSPPVRPRRGEPAPERRAPGQPPASWLEATHGRERV